MPNDRKLPHAGSAYAERAKVVSYLLNPTHSDGRGKNEFFRSFGFAPDRWQVLAETLQEVARASPVKDEVVTEFGTNYVVEGEMETPIGRRVWVRTVWEITPEKPAPRLVTAYPGKAKHD